MELPPNDYDVANGVENREKLYRQFVTESDRGIALAASGLIEWHLKVLARLHIHELTGGNGDERDAFRNSFFGPMGIASSLSSASKFCLGTRLIDENTYLAIQRIRKIRNPCAHSFDDATFDSEYVGNWLKKIPTESGFGEEIQKGANPGSIQIAFADSGESLQQAKEKLGENGPQSITVEGCWQKLQFVFACAAIEDRIMGAIVGLANKKE